MLACLLNLCYVPGTITKMYQLASLFLSNIIKEYEDCIYDFFDSFVRRQKYFMENISFLIAFMY